MKKIASLMFIAGLLLVSGEAVSQNLNRILRKTVVEPTRRANNVVRNEAEDQAEEEAEKHITNAIMEGFGIGEDVEYDSEYKFDSWFRMQITNYKKNGKVEDKVVYDSYVNKTNRTYGLQYQDDDAKSTILFDSERYAMIILADSDGEKTGFASQFDPEILNDSVAESAEANDFKPLKTGKTKKILGYTCDEYLVDDEEAEVHMWISEKLGKEISKEMLSNPNAFGAAFQLTRNVEGMTLEYDLVDKNSGEKTEMIVTDLDLNRNHSISTEGYTILTMNMQN